jgi:hypothetical protein
VETDALNRTAGDTLTLTITVANVTAPLAGGQGHLTLLTAGDALVPARVQLRWGPGMALQPGAGAAVVVTDAWRETLCGSLSLGFPFQLQLTSGGRFANLTVSSVSTALPEQAAPLFSCSLEHRSAPAGTWVFLGDGYPSPSNARCGTPACATLMLSSLTTKVD